LIKLAQNSRIRLEPTIGGNRTLLDGHDISSRIPSAMSPRRVASISASESARVDGRAAARDGEGGGVVMEGRDIGRKSFPTLISRFFWMRIPWFASSVAWNSKK